MGSPSPPPSPFPAPSPSPSYSCSRSPLTSFASALVLTFIFFKVDKRRIISIDCHAVPAKQFNYRTIRNTILPTIRFTLQPSIPTSITMPSVPAIHLNNTKYDLTDDLIHPLLIHCIHLSNPNFDYHAVPVIQINSNQFSQTIQNTMFPQYNLILPIQRNPTQPTVLIMRGSPHASPCSRSRLRSGFRRFAST